MSNIIWKRIQVNLKMDKRGRKQNTAKGLVALKLGPPDDLWSYLPNGWATLGPSHVIGKRKGQSFQP